MCCPLTLSPTSPALKECPLLAILLDASSCGRQRTKNITKRADEEALVVQFRKLFRYRRFQDNNYRNTSGLNHGSGTKQGYSGHCGKWGHWARDWSKQTPVPPTSSTSVHQANALHHQANQGSEEECSFEHTNEALKFILRSIIKGNERTEGPTPDMEVEKEEEAIALISELTLTTTIPNNRNWVLDTGYWSN